MTVKMEEGSTTSTGVNAQAFYYLPRNSSTFSGADSQDPCKWLNDYERVSTYNLWDESVRLANVVFYLTDTALQWFDNNEESFTNWDIFKQHFEATFGRSEDVKRRAEEVLRIRAQRSGETVESYIQDVLSLCKTMDPNLTEEQKIGHLMKGVAEEFYQVLMNKEIMTVQQFIKHCHQIEKMRKRRVTRPQFERLPNVTALSCASEGLSVMIRRIIREEIQRLLPQVTTCNEVKEESLETIVREEVQNTLAPISRPNDYRRVGNEAPRVEWSTKSIRTEPSQRRSSSRERKTDLWRTTADVPICFHCGRAGHVLRYCCERRRTIADARSRREMSPSRVWESDSVSDYGRDNETDSRRYRSGSPFPRRNPISRRSSRSPTRRQSRYPITSRQEN